jgi:hypothetical protein
VTDFIWIPKSRDGSLFLPTCKQGKGYKVGRKGEERYYETYQEALTALRGMPTPYWRRPNKKSGRFGIVYGESWVKIPTSVS